MITIRSATASTGVIRATAHHALQELRVVIGVLRDGADPVTPEPPQPTLAQIPALVDESCAAGMRVTARSTSPTPTTLPQRSDGRPTGWCRRPDQRVQARAATAVAVAVTGGEQLVIEVVSRRPVAGDRATICVLLVDDDPLVRSGLRMMLAGAEQIEVVAEAEDGMACAPPSTCTGPMSC
jgi:hypothetical protein